MALPDLGLTITVTLQLPDFSPLTDDPVARHTVFEDDETLRDIFEYLGTFILTNFAIALLDTDFSVVNDKALLFCGP